MSKKIEKKIFGMALDPSDDPISLELKRAWIQCSKENLEGSARFRDPYEAIIQTAADVIKSRGIQQAGQFPVPSWIQPKPEESDYSCITTQKIGQFYDNGLNQILNQLRDYVKENIFPAMPIMLGVDHSATLGVISALSEKYGAENLSVIVLDQHFDAIPLSVRMDISSRELTDSSISKSIISSAANRNYPDQCCCGNFWAYLLEAKKVLPQNLAFIGVADYPLKNASAAFRQHYLHLEQSGCRFFPLDQFKGEYHLFLKDFIQQSAKTSHLYISLDLDVGSYAFSLAARYMDRPGISLVDLLLIAEQIQSLCHSGKTIMSGFDVMEFNMHYLDIEMDGGVKDHTLSAVRDFIKILTLE